LCAARGLHSFPTRRSSDLAAAKWLSERKVALVGSDNWAVEAVPGEDADRPFQVHQWLLTRHGIYLLENLDLERLAAEKVYEFALDRKSTRLNSSHRTISYA